jgi:mono/diheme cytochrome c family protein
MKSVMNVFAASIFALSFASQAALRAMADQPPARPPAVPLAIFRNQIRIPAESLPVPLGYTREQVVLGDRVFHGEAAGGRCSECHGVDAKGTPNGSDLTTGMYGWADGTVNGIKRVLMHNMSIAPAMDGKLQPSDVDAVAAYVWAMGRHGSGR